MSIRAKLVRRSRFGIACAVFISTASPLSYVQAAPALIIPQDAGLIRVQKSQTVLPDIIGDLFPQDPIANPGTPGTPGTPPGTPGTDPSCDFIECGPGTGTTPGTGGVVGGYGGTYNPYNPYSTGYYGTYDPRRMDRSTAVGAEYQCNLFESPPLGEVLSSINALKAVVVPPACDGKVNMQNVVAENNKIAQVVKDFRQYVDNPDLITAEKAGEIGNGVDVAIQSAATIAATFANTALSKKCREGMDAGKVATSISSVINGLTPYALMASSVTGGTAAVPFIMGGAVLTGVVSNIGQIIDQNTTNLEDEMVRRAVVENTCQYIRIEQKYRFLIQDRKAQMKLITQDVKASESMFSAKVKRMSPQTNALIARKNAIDLTVREINAALATTSDQFKGDREFFKQNETNVQTACNFGVNVAQTTDDKTSYASVMLASLDQAMAAYGRNSGVQAATLKSNAQTALKDLKAYATKANHSAAETKACAETSKYFVKTIEDSASTSKQLLKFAKTAVDGQLQKTAEYSMLSASIGTLDQKKIQAQRVANSLDQMKAFADTMTRSEIDNSMKNIRESLFARNWKVLKSPVEKWFNRSEKLHTNSIAEFRKGLESLRKQALALGTNIKTAPVVVKAGATTVQRYPDVRSDAQQLKTFTLKNVPLESEAHRNVCRELRGVWDMYGVAIRQLASMNAFCGLIEPYLLDARKEDHELVVWCRGDRMKNGGQSKILAAKNDLVKDHIKDWAMVVGRRLNELACVDPTGQP
jgi:ElaB/YqjD/DUF883 family membrane-anchored ribosome-binding protein